MIEINQLLNKEITKSFKVYGAFEDNILKGVIATDKRKRHINLFFVDKSSQAKGIGKKLMNIVKKLKKIQIKILKISLLK